MTEPPLTPSGPNSFEYIQRYWQALGQFIDQFAAIEAAMQTALWHYANVPAPVAKAVFSGVRINTTMDFIRRLFEVSNIDESIKADAVYVFSQLSAINKARNDIVHFGAKFAGVEGSQAIVTNEALALTEERQKTIPISPEILVDMTADLRKIEVHLFDKHIKTERSESVRHPGVAVLLNASWRYKPAPQEKRPKKTRDKPPKR